MQVKKQQLELVMEQQTGSKLEKEYVKVVYCYCAYLTSVQCTPCKMPGWMKYKLDLEEAEEPEIELLVSFGSYKKQGNSRKH